MPSPIEIMEIDSAKLRRMQMLHVNFILLDLRSSEDYAAGHIKGALNVPYAEFLNEIVRMIPQKDTPVVVYDADGLSASAIVAEAAGQGYINMVVLEGGYQRWAKPVI